MAEKLDHFFFFFISAMEKSLMILKALLLPQAVRVAEMITSMFTA